MKRALGHLAILLLLTGCPRTDDTGHDASEGGPVDHVTLPDSADTGPDDVVSEMMDTGPSGDIADTGPDDVVSDWLDSGPPRDVAPYACGDAGLCNPATEYCVIEFGDGPRDGQVDPAIQQCMPVPAACVGAPTCDCIARNGTSWCSQNTAPMLTCSDNTGAVYCQQIR